MLLQNTLALLERSQILTRTTEVYLNAQFLKCIVLIVCKFFIFINLQISYF